MKWIAAFIISALPVAAHPDPAHTLAEINQHLEGSPDDIGLMMRKAELLLKTGQPLEAAPVLAGALRLSPDSPRLLLLEARLSEHMGEGESAAARVEELIRRFPKDADAWGMHARLLDEAERTDEAISAKLRQLEIEAGTHAGDYLTCAAWLNERANPGDSGNCHPIDGSGNHPFWLSDWTSGSGDPDGVLARST
jgi:predicted Zn-dependent protease